MSPFYRKEREPNGDNWVKWKGEPHDLRTLDDKDTGVSIYSVPGDPEQVQASVRNDTSVFVRGERGNTIFPGESGILNRDDLDVVKGSTGEIIARVIHSEKLIK